MKVSVSVSVSAEQGETVVLPASLMIEGLVWLCRNAVLLSKNTDAFTAIVLTLSSVTHTPWMYQLRVKQLFPLNICRWC